MNIVHDKEVGALRKKLASPKLLSAFLLAFVLIGGSFLVFYFQLN